ncbi:MAG: multiheme c-type cytochrome [Thermodesulfobacteriota bacterium]
MLNRVDLFFVILGLYVIPLTVGAITDHPIVKKEGYTESQVCGACHRMIFKQWGNSLHASSISDPVFLGVYNEVEKEENRRFCLKCHAPTVRVTGDYNLTQPITKEGVTCDFCHTIKGVDLSKEEPFEFALGFVKRGPLKSDLEIGHENLFSEIHLKAEFCAGCHEVVNENGFHVMSTYSEWKQGPYAEKGIQCQNCHMPEEFGVPIVNPEIARTQHNVTAHKFLGGHSQINITTAAMLTQVIEKADDHISVVVYVTNAEAGHSLPTGIPSRKVILTVKLLDPRGQELKSKEVVYRRVLVDGEGIEIPEENIKEMFLKATSVKSDNRIRPKETRREEFAFPLPKGIGGSLLVESTLEYEFRVPYLEPNIMKVEMAEDEQLIEIEKRSISTWGWFALLVIVLVVLFLLHITYQRLRR